MKRSAVTRFGLLAVLVGSIAVSIALHASDAPKKIRVIYTNDTLGYLEPCG